jgi:hypothetical protein
MRWLLAWLVFNALVVVWRLLVTLPKLKAGHEAVRDERAGAVTGPF